MRNFMLDILITVTFFCFWPLHGDMATFLTWRRVQILTKLQNVGTVFIDLESAMFGHKIYYKWVEEKQNFMPIKNVTMTFCAKTSGLGAMTLFLRAGHVDRWKVGYAYLAKFCPHITVLRTICTWPLVRKRLISRSRGKNRKNVIFKKLSSIKLRIFWPPST